MPDDPDLLSSYEEHVRRHPVPPAGYLIEQDPPVVRMVGPGTHHLDHVVLFSALTEGDADLVIERELERARSLGCGIQWNVCGHDHPADLRARLERRGFTCQAEETVLVREVQAPPPPAALPADGTIERVTTPAQVEEVVAVQTEVWGPALEAWLRASFLRHLDEPGRATILLTRVEGHPAATAWVMTSPGDPFAYLFGGTVIPRWRGRGLYRALVEARAEAARRSGQRWLVTDANGSSEPILRHLGFAPIATRSEMVIEAPQG